MSSSPLATARRSIGTAGAEVRRMATFFGLVAATAVALVGGWRMAIRSDTGMPAYETCPIAVGVVERSISATGSVKALVTVDVGSQLSGLIAEMKADFNALVSEGDVLAVIDRAPFQAKVASATANLAIARADVGEKAASVAKARAQLVQAKRDFDRYEALAPKGHASRLQREQSETQLGIATAELGIAEAQLASAKATVEQRQAELAQAQIDLDRTLIRSPVNGVVIDRRMEPGQTVTAEYQTPILFQIAQDLSQIQIDAQVDEADIGAVFPGMPVTFTVETFPDETFEGEVDQVRLATTKVGGVVTYKVVIRAHNPNLRLYPDMTATVQIIGARHKDVLNVPNEALRFQPPDAAEDESAGRDADRVWVLAADGTLQKRAIRVGLVGDEAAEILSGEVVQGERVALRLRRAGARARP